MAAPPTAGARTAAVAFILVTVALDVIAMGLVIPVLPKLVESMTGGERRRRRWSSACSAPPGR